MRPFTERIAKPLLPLMGVPLIQFALDDLASAGVEVAVMNYHHLPQETLAGYRKLESGSMRTHYSDESKKLLGSAGGIAHALPQLGSGSFYYWNTSDLRWVDLEALSDRHHYLVKKHGVIATLTLMKGTEADEKNVEILVDSQNELVVGKKEPVAQKNFFCGVAVLEAKAFAGLSPHEAEELIPKIILPAIAQKNVGVYLEKNSFLDGGEPHLWWKSHLRLMEWLDSGIAPLTWQERIKKSSHRIAKNVWSQGSPLASAPLKAPAYWGSSEPIPQAVGPRAVFYGNPALAQEARNKGFSNGIGLDDLWHSCSLT